MNLRLRLIAIFMRARDTADHPLRSDPTRSENDKMIMKLLRPGKHRTRAEPSTSFFRQEHLAEANVVDVIRARLVCSRLSATDPSQQRIPKSLNYHQGPTYRIPFAVLPIDGQLSEAVASR